MKMFFQLFLATWITMFVLSHALKLAILQNKGGGHGEIGFALAKAAKGAEVTILQDSSYKPKQAPFSSYGELSAKVQEIKLSDTSAVMAALEAAKFDVIVDNNSKDAGAVKSILDVAVKSGCSKWLYISSGGMYTGDAPADGAGYAEACCKVKEDNECRTVENTLFDSAMKDQALSFRPQYIYGTHTNKRGNIDFFVDRIVRDLPVPMVGDGTQMVALTHVDDVASLLWKGVTSKQAGIFNAGTDKFISYSGLCEKIAKKLGKSVNYFSYDPKKLSKDLPKPGFPYRPTTFVLNPAKAKAAFNWQLTHDIAKDIDAWVDQYLTLKLDAKEFKEDEALVAIM